MISTTCLLVSMAVFSISAEEKKEKKIVKTEQTTHQDEELGDIPDWIHLASDELAVSGKLDNYLNRFPSSEYYYLKASKKGKSFEGLTFWVVNFEFDSEIFDLVEKEYQKKLEAAGIPKKRLSSMVTLRSTLLEKYWIEYALSYDNGSQEKQWEYFVLGVVSKADIEKAVNRIIK